MKDRKTQKLTLPQFNKLTVLVSIVAAMASMSASAETSEQFSLTKQAELLYDGGSGTLTGVHEGIPYEIIQGFAVAQGDMVLGRVLPNGKLDVALRPRGLGQASAFDRWADGIIPYQFSGEVSQIQRDRAQQAIAHWNANTTVKLIKRDDSNADNYSDYINFELGGGCASYVGKKGGEQTVWLADNCTVGSIIHEVGHAIGLFHEHTRPDRDNFVTVNLKNVTSGKELNFDQILAGALNYSDYDYGSIMHYGEYFFSRNGEPSISVPDGVDIGQRDALSRQDINSINNMYATDLKLGLNSTKSEKHTQIDLVVSNIGKLGANTLQLTARWGNDVDWLSISTDSGWDCQQYGPELRCTRSTLKGEASSRFSILADAKEAGEDTLKVRVESRTRDNELNNNVFNDVITTAVVDEPTSNSTPLQVDPGSSPDAPAPAPEKGGAEPDIEKTDNTDNTDNTNNTNNTNNTSTASGGSGGGGAALYLLALLFSTRMKRRH